MPRLTIRSHTVLVRMNGPPCLHYAADVVQLQSFACGTFGKAVNSMEGFHASDGLLN